MKKNEKGVTLHWILRFTFVSGILDLNLLDGTGRLSRFVLLICTDIVMLMMNQSLQAWHGSVAQLDVSQFLGNRGHTGCIAICVQHREGNDNFEYIGLSTFEFLKRHLVVMLLCFLSVFLTNKTLNVEAHNQDGWAGLGLFVEEEDCGQDIHVVLHGLLDTVCVHKGQRQVGLVEQRADLDKWQVPR